MICSNVFYPQRVIDLVKRHISVTETVHDANPIFVVTLPVLETHKFPNLFEEIENYKNYLGIITFHLEQAVMEDVFTGVSI